LYQLILIRIKTFDSTGLFAQLLGSKARSGGVSASGKINVVGDVRFSAA